MTNLLIGFPDVPKNAHLLRSTAAWDSVCTLSNTRSGHRYSIAKLASTQTELIRNNYDLGSGNTKASNFFIIARADLLQSASCSRVVLRGSTQKAFTPTDVGSPTLWVDATRSVTADSSNRVGTWADLSGNGRNFTQSTSGNKPLWTRADNKENYLVYSEQFDEAPWTSSTGSTFPSNSAANPLDGAVTADTWQEDSSTGNHRCTQDTTIAFLIGVSYRASIYVKANGRTRFEFYLAGTAFGGATPNAVFDVNTGTIVSSGGGASATINDLGSGWFRCNITATAGATGVGRMDLYLRNGAGSNNYTGDGASGVYVYGAQMCVATADSTYLKTTTVGQLSGVNGNRALFFDGLNDYLTSSANVADVIATDKFTIFLVVNYITALGAAYQSYLDHSSSVFYLFAEAGEIRMDHYDGSYDRVAKTATPGTNYIIKARHESGNIYLSLNNGSEASTASGALTGTITQPLRMGYNAVGAQIGELIIYNTNIGSSAETAVYEYLRDKWQTTGAVVENSFSTATLYGPRSDDYVTTFSDTTAYRNWWVDYEFSATSTAPHSKVYFGSWFDFGADPDSIKPSRKQSRSPVYYAASGAAQVGRTDEPAYRFEITWRGISDDKVRDFMNNVVSDIHYRQGVFLYTATNHEPLDNQRLIHCRLIDVETEQGADSNDWNTVKAIFEEMVG